MANSKEILLTYEGLQKLESELEQLKTVTRKEVALKIKQAMSFGDLSENAEYDEAKAEQAVLEVRVLQLETLLKNAKVIDEDEVTTDVVNIGSRVKVLDLEFNEEIEYSIVGSTEASAKNGKISNESPLGTALIGKSVGETVEVCAPLGILKFEILNISK